MSNLDPVAEAHRAMAIMVDCENVLIRRDALAALTAEVARLRARRADDADTLRAEAEEWHREADRRQRELDERTHQLAYSDEHRSQLLSANADLRAEVARLKARRPVVCPACGGEDIPHFHCEQCGFEEAPPGEERKAIAALKRLAKQWPKTLWLFSASGSLHVMRRGPDGEQVFLPDRGANGGWRTGGADPAYSVGTIDIPNDGGDW